MVKLDRVVKRYVTRKTPVTAINGISLIIRTGAFVVITGPSGSGKTTLLNLIGGMTRPDQGCVVVNGQDLNQLKDGGLSDFRADTIGFVFQFQSMLATLNVLDNIRMPRRFSQRHNQEDNAESLLAQVGLSSRRHAFAHELSVGQQRRVVIARSLMNDPLILLCDEPTGDLDIDSEQMIMALLTEAHQKGVTIIMVTHNPHLKSYATDTFSIVNGCLG